MPRPDDEFVPVIGAAGCQAPVEQPLRELLFLYHQRQHDGNSRAFLSEQFVERLRLRGRAREAVEEEPIGVGVVVEGGADDLDDDLIGNELTFINDTFCRKAKRGPTRDLRAKQVSGTQVLQSIFGYQTFRLRTLPATRRSK